MKKTNNLLIFAIGFFIFIASYFYDTKIDLFFKASRLPALDLIFSLITNFAFVALVILVLPSIFIYKTNKKSVNFLVLAYLSSIIAAFIIKFIVLRQRPIEAFNYPFTNIIDYSFPSMHTMAVFALLPLLIYFFQRQKYFWIGFAFLVGFTRIYFGFHYLSDVAFGALAGYFIGEFVLGVYEKKHEPKK